RRFGTAARTDSRTDGSRFTVVPCRPLRTLVVPLFETIEQIDETGRNALAHHLVVHGAELLADFALNVPPQAGLCREIAFPRPRPRSRQLRILHFLSSPPALCYYVGNSRAAGPPYVKPE